MSQELGQTGGQPVEEIAHVESIQDEAARFPRPSGRTLFGIGAAVFLIPAAFGAANFVQNTTAFDENLDISGGQGTIPAVYAMDKECHGGYDVQASGVTAELQADPTVFNIPVGALVKHVVWWRQTVEHMDIVNEVCTTGEDGTVTQSSKPDGTKTYVISFKPDAFTVSTHEENPEQTKFETEYGAGVALVRSQESLLNAIPKVDVDNNAKAEDRVRGMAETAALHQAANSCGQTVWPVLAPRLGQAVITDFVADGKKFGIDVDPANVEVELPETIATPNQYSDNFQAFTTPRAGLTIKVPGSGAASKEFTCSLAADLKDEPTVGSPSPEPSYATK